MRNVIVYFHGYGSNPKSHKVAMLKSLPNVEVFAYTANIDPDIAVTEVSENIDRMLLDDTVNDVNIIFIGTSLGAWLASKLAYTYCVKTVLINPSVTPHITLKRYGIPDDICNKYTPLIPSFTDKFIFAEDDVVIDNTAFRNFLITTGYDVTVVPSGGHRFSGDTFKQYVMDELTF